MRVLLLAAFTAAVSDVSDVTAQSIRAEGIYAFLSEPDMRRGLGVGVALQHRAVELLVQTLWHDGVRSGRTCGGFIPEPADCPEETQDLTSTFTSVRISYVMVSKPAPLMGRMGLGIGGSKFSGTRSGRITGRSLNAYTFLAGVDFSLGASYLPFRATSIRLSFSGASGLWLSPPAGCEDCYEPYGTLGAVTVSFGLEYRFR